MIYIIFLWIIPITLSITICYLDAKRFHRTMKYFLEECLISIFLGPIVILFIFSRFSKYFYVKYPKINTDFITKFLNKRL